ncbi:MAG TPA: DUF2793 domain-containing protein [Pseudolabrys sp.]|nr:DUF2793 domain-containing protein [Pseudolabrys sp.]
MTTTANLGLPCIQGSQAQKHVTHNEALRILDTLVHLAVIDRDLSAPPEHTFEGDRYIVNAEATGAWAGCEGAIMARQDGVWQISQPRPGWLAYVIDEGALVVWSGSAWIDAISALTSLNNMALLGIGTTADATNPLSAKLNNTLFVAKTVAEGGDGHLRYKLSKESAAKTLSLLFQDNYSGRAEIGLTGDDNFHFKVSPDGSAWHDGIVIDRNTGAVTFPNSTLAGGREILSGNRTYYVRGDGSDANNGLSNSAGGAFLTLQRAYNVIASSLDLGGKTITVQIADGTYAGGLSVSQPWTGGGQLVVQGNAGVPSNVTVGTTGADCISVTCPLPGVLAIKDMKLTTAASGSCISHSGSGPLEYANLEFGAAATFHVVLGSKSAMVTASGNSTISGGAMAHWYNQSGFLACAGKTVTLTGTPAFSSNFAFVGALAVAYLHGNTFSGGATGVRYGSVQNSMLYVGGAGANYLPGNAAGVTSGGGLYI